MTSTRFIRWTGALAVGMMLTMSGCGRSSLGSDTEVYDEVLALRTAVASRRLDLVEHCHRDLKLLSEEQRLNPSHWLALQTIIDDARNDRWENAVHELTELMKSVAPPGD